MDAILDSLTPSQRAEFKPVPIELKAGECSFHHPLMVHGSYANETPRPRRAVVINAFRDGVVSASDQPPLEGVPSVATGEKMSGQFFPLLFNPAIKT
jgi:ectoine hydroxylase-related dioxygenase (phytanoyl-CoA dioxygenase family)